MHHRLFSALALTVACSGTTRGDSGDPDTGTADQQSAYPYCEDSPTPLGWDEATPDGTIPSEVLDGVEGTLTGEFTYASGATTGIELTVTRTGEPAWVESEAVYPTGPGSYIDIGIECFDYLRVPVDVSLSLEDGGFDEQWSQETSMWSGSGYYTVAPGSFGISATLDTTALNGSYTVTEVTTTDYDYLEIVISGGVADGASAGSISLQGQRSLGEVVSFGSVAEVGTWTAAAATP